MRHRLEVELGPGRHAFARLIARLHALGLEVVSVRLEDGSARISVIGGASADRIEAAVNRLVEVTRARCTSELLVTTTRTVVNRQPVLQACGPLPAAALRARALR